MCILFQSGVCHCGGEDCDHSSRNHRRGPQEVSDWSPQRSSLPAPDVGHDLCGSAGDLDPIHGVWLQGASPLAHLYWTFPHQTSGEEMQKNIKRKLLKKSFLIFKCSHEVSIYPNVSLKFLTLVRCVNIWTNSSSVNVDFMCYCNPFWLYSNIASTFHFTIDCNPNTTFYYLKYIGVIFFNELIMFQSCSFSYETSKY